ncbi:hypothetical protein D3C86_2028650 [compost metagenome]
MMSFISSRDEQADPVPARVPSEGLETAPGSYVKARLNPIFSGTTCGTTEEATA